MTDMIKKMAARTESSDMELINQYTRRELSPDEVYTFTVTLCDNEIDRDNEQFPLESLNTLSKLFLGKTGIFDHNPKAENQAARIYKTGVELTNELNSVGEQYARLTACAYIVRTDKMAELISEIDAGIKKEVSISCSVGQVICSKCGADLKVKPCRHQKGKDGVYHLLDSPTDAYEWSFVAVPAQRAAGVTKKFETEVSNHSAKASDSYTDENKTMQGGENMIINEETGAKIKSITDSGKVAAVAKDGENYVVSEVAEGVAVEDFITAEQVQKMTGVQNANADAVLGILAVLAKSGVTPENADKTLDGLLEKANKSDELATKVADLEKIKSEHDAWFDAVVKEALDNGVRAEDSEFDREWWEGILKSQPMAKVKAQSDKWLAKAEKELNAGQGRISRVPSEGVSVLAMNLADYGLK